MDTNDGDIDDHGKCKNCEVIVNSNELISCLFCKMYFHAICPGSFETICTTTFLSNFHTASNKSGAYANRSGHFKFICDTCMEKCNNDMLSTPRSDNAESVKNYIETAFTSFKGDIISTINSVVATDVDQRLSNGVDISPKPPQSYSQAVGINRFPSNVTVTPAANIEKEVLVLTTDKQLDQSQSSSIKKSLTKSLKNTKVSFMRSNNTTGKITVGFPDADSKKKAESAINRNTDLDEIGFKIRESKKMLPKITVLGVPLSIFDELTYNEDDANELRVKEKAILRDQFLQKNDDIKTLVDEGHTFEIVYINKCLKSCTVAVKVSPLLRNTVINAKSSSVYIENRKCTVVDRFFYKQCYHCQKIGHTSHNCPGKLDLPTCMYCSNNHKSSSCPVKKDQDKYKCCNCAISTDKAVSSSCTTHTANSEKCPLIIKECRRIQNNTDFSSKNIM